VLLLAMSKFVLLIVCALALAMVCSVEVSARGTPRFQQSMSPVHRPVRRVAATTHKTTVPVVHSAAPPRVGDAATVACISALAINAGTSLTAPINSYGPTYQANKARVLNALRATSMSECQIRMWFAIGMLETSTFSASDRDTSKDGTASQNYSCFNLNQDMLTRAGQPTDALNSDDNIAQTAQAVAAVTAKYGINGVLNYLRGGYTGWQNGVSYEVRRVTY